MKAQIHPKWHDEAMIVCACGNTFTLGATQPQINVDVCSACHPFYTGKMKFVDAAGRVDAFKSKMKGAQSERLSKTEKRRLKKEKRMKEEHEKPDSLKAIRKSVVKTSSKKN